MYRTLFSFVAQVSARGHARGRAPPRAPPRAPRARARAGPALWRPARPARPRRARDAPARAARTAHGTRRACARDAWRPHHAPRPTPPRARARRALRRRQARPSLPDEVGGVVWFGEDSPHATCYFPFFLAQGRLPRAYTHGTQGEYSAGSAWWTFNLIKRFIDLNFRAMIEDVRAAQEECEAGGRKVLAEAEAAALAALRAPSPSSSKRGATSSGAAKPHSPGRLLKATAKPKATSAPPPTPSAPPASPAGATAAAARAIALLENATCTHAEYVQSAWQSLFADLMVRYKNGYTNTIVAQGIVREKTIGYPAWWLRLVGYTGWMDFVKSRGAEHAQQRAESGDLEADSSKEPDMSVWAAGDDTAARKAASTQPAWARAAGAHPAIFTCIALLCGAVLFGLGVLAGPHLAKPRALCGAGSWPQASAEAPLLPAKADREMVPGRNA